MARLSESASQLTFVDYLLDLTPGLLAAFAIFGPSLGMGGPSFATQIQTFGFEGQEAGGAGISLMLALAGIWFGLDRARRHGSVRLGLGVFCCAFAGALAGLKLF